VSSVSLPAWQHLRRARPTTRAALVASTTIVAFSLIAAAVLYVTAIGRLPLPEVAPGIVPWWPPLVACACVACCVIVMRAYSVEHRRLAHFRLLYESLRTVHRAPTREQGVSALLRTACALYGADGAWIALFGRREGDPPLVAWVLDESESALRTRALTQVQSVALRSVRRRGRVVDLRDARDDASLGGLARELGLERMMATILHGESGEIGIVAVGHRRPGQGSFGTEDTRLFETFASHAAILLENDRLEQSVSDLEELREQLHRQAYHDALTGLPNRAYFTERVASAIAKQGDRPPAVLFLDLDDFKTINDSLGHHAGDELLVAAASRVRAAVRGGDVPARLGGDEFAVLANGATVAEIAEIADRLVAALDAPFVIEGRTVSVHASVGVAFGAGVTNADELLRNADVAMYSAKQGGKRRHVTYEPKMHVRVRHRQELVSALELAVKRGEIEVHYQPIVDLVTGRMVAVEALARWDRPAKGLVAPASFVPLADEIGLMVDIGRDVLRAACRQVRSWQHTFSGCEDLAVNVNLSPTELHGRALAQEVSEILDETGLAPDRLVLEITESGVMHNPSEARATMRALRELGVSLALDDFGTGHSSLAHLRDFPIDTLKIAREFVSGLPDGLVDVAFVETIVRLASSLDLQVVAEGVESIDQTKIVAGLGCNLGQGYHFGAPVGPIGVAGYLAAEMLPARGVALRVA
jgi:diguanylate cyclase (GGDEF)-like protein